MFTGIIKSVGEIVKVKEEGTNKHFFVKSDFTTELQIDESVAHNGVCLTVVNIENNVFQVTAIKETLDLTSLHQWQVGTLVNLERAAVLNSRLDGHIVQGHVDTVAVCKSVVNEDGSWVFTFQLGEPHNGLVVSKGSITVNGTSLTVVNPNSDEFSVAIIPYTYENTCFKSIKTGVKVNIEYDIVGKYVQSLLSPYKN